MAEKKRLKSNTISISTFENVMKQFDQAANQLRLDEGVVSENSIGLRHPPMVVLE
jgi:hypothetical protein